MKRGDSSIINVLPVGRKSRYNSSFFLFPREEIAEEILDLLPVRFNGEYSADESCDQDLKNIAAGANVQVGKGIL
jgi:hypothetical protein